MSKMLMRIATLFLAFVQGGNAETLTNSCTGDKEQKSTKADKMNVLLILTDQHRWDALGCYGNGIVKTPNIDRLATSGVRFNRAFTPSSICTPARASLFTGRFPGSHGLIGNQPRELPTDMPKLSDFLEGYDRFLIGKWHIEDSKGPSDYGFKGHDFPGYGFPGCGVYKNFSFGKNSKAAVKPGRYYAKWLQGKGFSIPEVSEIYYGENPNFRAQELYGKLNALPEASAPAFLADEAILSLQNSRNSGRPFFMWMNFWGPHTPCVIPEPYYSMYDPETIPVDPAFIDDLSDKPEHYRDIARMWGVYDLDWKGWQKIIARYYGYITLIDDSVGRLLDYLEQNNLMNNTLIVFTTDHGDAMGGHRLIEKGEFMFDSTYRIPMIARHPDCANPGSECDEFVYLHDLMPTLARLASGVCPDTNGESQDILPLLAGEKASTGRDHVYGEFSVHFTSFPQRMIRTRTHKLVFNANAKSELYDLVNDPYEIHNRIGDATYAGIKKDLTDRLEAEMVWRKDPLLSWFRRIRDFL